MPAPQAEQTGDPSLLLEYLGAHDAVCPLCAYSLRGLMRDVCPECGAALRLRMQLAEPRLGWFFVGLVGLSVGFGFAALMLVFAGIVFVLHHHRVPLRDVIMLASMLLLGALLIGAWVRWWPRIRVRGRAVRTALALAAWALSIAGGITVMQII